jgi:uncharacterized protein (DUF952 family)
MRETYHLSPRVAWLAYVAGSGAGRYEADSLADEGFVHCTDGLAELRLTFDRHFRDDPRPFVALTIDLDAIDVAWRYDTPGSPYPHIYGPIQLAAIRSTFDVIRTRTGRFERLQPSMPQH